jgi:uncharacterized repeat protein (TIGR03803 family)
MSANNGMSHAARRLARVIGMGLAIVGASSPALAGAEPDTVDVQLLANLTRKTGYQPEAGLTLAPDGTYYGTAQDFKVNESGSIYRFTPGVGVSLVHAFGGADGYDPVSSTLTLASDGALYGTTFEGGANDCGVVFRLKPPAKYRVVHDFDCAQGGGYPVSGVILGRDGRLYGTTQGGGSGGVGVVFRMSLSGKYSVIANSDASTGMLVTRLLEGDDGNFYGVGNIYQPFIVGVVFKLDPKKGKLVHLHESTADESAPAGPMVYTADRSAMMGPFGSGVFELRDGVYSEVAYTLYEPSGLIVGPDGRTLYLIAYTEFYSLTPDYKLTLLARLSGGSDAIPTFAPDGSIVLPTVDWSFDNKLGAVIGISGF